jgi:hypothetical protein
MQFPAFRQTPERKIKKRIRLVNGNPTDPQADVPSNGSSR